VTDGTTQSATEPPVRRLGMRTTLTYAVGSVAYGVKDNGFQAFLLIFYNQVMGLSAVAVGATIMAALILDAFADPLIGVASDRTRSRWGRRHPWMYASALPIAVGWLLLWNPPAMSDAALLGWVFASAVVVRTAVSSYEVPSSALTPELSADYDERTRIIAYRHLFGWIGGLSMLVAAYTLFLVPTPGEPNGLLNREGYRLYAITGAIVIFVAIMASAVGTHREIGRLPQVTNDPVPLRQVFGELLETIRNRPFAILMAAGLCCYTAQGLAFALSNYLYTFVWRFPASAFLMIGGVLLAGVVVAFVIAPRLAHRFGKRRAANLADRTLFAASTEPFPGTGQCGDATRSFRHDGRECHMRCIGGDYCHIHDGRRCRAFRSDNGTSIGRGLCRRKFLCPENDWRYRYLPSGRRAFAGRLPRGRYSGRSSRSNARSTYHRIFSECRCRCLGSSFALFPVSVRSRRA
jgi:glycoside/pentoside/hexuronide:cation symporter, GPH family